MGYPEHPAKSVSKTWLVFAVILAIAGFVFFVPVRTGHPPGSAIPMKGPATTWDLLTGQDK